MEKGLDVDAIMDMTNLTREEIRQLGAQFPDRIPQAW